MRLQLTSLIQARGTRPLVFSMLMACLGLAHGQGWQVDSASSSVGFVTVKNGVVVEAHRFSEVSGEVSADGAAVISIALDSVDTLIPIRDGRMRDMLFETDQFPMATVSAQLELDPVLELEVGDTSSLSVTADLSLHGISQPVALELTLLRADADTVVVSSTRSAVVYGAAFGLAAGIEALRNVAGLDAITPNVAVSFVVQLGRDQPED